MPAKVERKFEKLFEWPMTRGEIMHVALVWPAFLVEDPHRLMTEVVKEGFTPEQTKQIILEFPTFLGYTYAEQMQKLRNFGFTQEQVLQAGRCFHGREFFG